MASMYITKLAICNLSTSLPQRSIAFAPRKVSRVCFTSSTNYTKGTKLYSSSNADVSVGDKAAEGIKDLKAKVSEIAEGSGEKTQEATDKASDVGQDAKAKLEELHEKNMETAGDLGEKTKEYAQDTKDAVEKGIESGGETAKDLGDTAQKNLQDAWDSTKDVTQKIKDAVEGKSDA